MRYHTVTDWLAWLENQTITNSSTLAFRQVKQVADRLNLLPFRHKVITVAGTNGKGSCVALLESIYQAAGYRVATFTSPHLFQFNERIRVEQKTISNDLLCELFDKIDRAREDIPLTYFNFSFLAALLWFQSVDLDVVVLEVGIGGRLDATNIVDANLGMIASIGLDHCQLLGNTREEIAVEKAGIFRANRPAVCGDKNPPKTLLEFVSEHQIPCFFQEKDFF